MHRESGHSVYYKIALRERDAARKTARANRISNYLDRIETTVDPTQSVPSAPLRSQAHAMIEKFRTASGPGQPCRTADNIESCGQTFALYQSPDGLKVLPFYCKSRACPVCADKRNQKWYHRSAAIMKKMTSCKHIVLTIRSSNEPLRDQISHLVKSFRRLRQSKLWTSHTPWGYWMIGRPSQEKL